MSDTLAFYRRKFASLNANKNRKYWPPETHHCAPHKPLLLLSVLDLAAEGELQRNFIDLSDELKELFTLYWSKIFPPEHRRGNIAMPYWYMRSEGFWHFQPRPGRESYVESAKRVQSISELEANLLGVKLDEALYTLICTANGREALRRVLLETYFVEEYQHALLKQGEVNVHAYHYSRELLDAAESGEDIREVPQDYAVRDQAFRTAVRRAYDHQCAMTGLRIVTAEGHSAVQAAHIVPWHETQNDNPRNGIALSPTCHWAFDEGLLTITDKYTIRISPQLETAENQAKHLLELADQPILVPIRNAYAPSRQALRRHREKIFRRR